MVILVFLAVCVSTRAQFMAPGVILTPLTDDGKSVAVAWAPHGDLLCILREISGTQKQLMIMKSDGTDEQAVTPVGNPIYAEWSWSGKKIAFEFTNADDRGVHIALVHSGRVQHAVLGIQQQCAQLLLL